ncbi:MAG: hypothetical protein AB7S75_21015 [Desulfococcaceae bacterium]
MNSWQTEWDLTIPKKEAIKLLHDLIQSPKETHQTHRKFKGKITGGTFDVTIKRSILWGIPMRKEIEGRGVVTDSNCGSHISAYFKVCAPYSYVNLDIKKLGVIISVFVSSLLGLFITTNYPEKLGFLNNLLVPLFFVTYFILITGALKYLFIKQKFKKISMLFEKTFSRYIKK